MLHSLVDSAIKKSANSLVKKHPKLFLFQRKAVSLQPETNHYTTMSEKRIGCYQQNIE